MFRKLVSNLSFSPALVGQLGFYARRLKKEEATRKAGLIFTVLALTLQSFAVFSPPEPANAASSNDLIYGGITSKADLLQNYDSNSKYRKVLDFAGITRADLEKTVTKEINNLSKGKGKDAWKSWGYQSFFSAAQGEVKYNANGVTVYSRPNYLFNSTPYTQKNGEMIKVLYGKSSRLGEFGIMYNCGNVFTTIVVDPPPPPPPTPPPPTAICTNLDTIIHSYNERRFVASAKVTNGATISNYTFTVTDNRGVVIKAFDYKSGSTTVTTGNTSFSPGTYTARVTVNTSLGKKTSNDCVDKFTIATPGITIEKSVNDAQRIKVALNEVFTYSIIVKNTGSLRLTNVVVTDDAPKSVEFITSDNGLIKDNRWQATIASLDSESSATFHIKAKVTTASEPGNTVTKNTACVDSPQISGNPDDCDDADVETPEVQISVCDLVTNKMITINKSDFNSSRHSTNPNDCIKLKVCDLETNAVIVIRKTQYDKNKHTEDLSQCSNIQVCDLETGEVITIKKNDFDKTKHTEDTEKCTPHVTYDKSASNISQKNDNATSVTAKADDTIEYSVTLHNVGDVDAEGKFVENLKDVTEYASIIDFGGGSYDESTKQLSWPSVILKPGERQTRMFTVKLLSTIPQAAQGTSDPSSYDCIMTNTFGNSLAIRVDCPVEKQVEEVIAQLPHTGPAENIFFAGGALSLVTYFYARSRQLKKEVRLIRRDVNTGVI